MANKKITELMAGTPTRDSLIESATDVGGTMVSRKFKVGAVADLNNIIVAEEYDDTRTYVYGEYRINEGVLYRCTTPINVAEAWTSAHWTAVMVTGEYKRVRIMTKAQFDLLSNDEKDGFIYVSDYPTKIQDIDNVNLTTSDNNKLLGVSVSGSDISVGAVDVSNNNTLDEGSAYSTYVNNKFDYYYNQYGNLLLFTLDFEMKARSASSGWAEIFKTSSVLSLKNAVIVSCISSLSHWNRVRINSNGTVDLNLVSSAASTERVSIQIMAFLA